MTKNSKSLSSRGQKLILISDLFELLSGEYFSTMYSVKIPSFEVGIVAHTCNLGPWETEARGWLKA